MILILICHALGDMAFQTAYMGDNKGKSIFVLLSHCITYGSLFYFFYGQTAFLLATGSHILIDGFTSRVFPRRKQWWMMWVDQGAHAIVLGVIWFLYYGGTDAMSILP